MARSIDVHTKHLGDIIERAVAHKGTSFIEVFQNCNIFNDGAWEDISNPKTRAEHTLELEHGQPLIYGKDRDRGIRLNGFEPESVALEGVDESELLVHDERAAGSHLAYMLRRMQYPDFPVPMGIFRSVQRPVYSEAVMEQVEQARAQKGPGNLKDLFHASETWTVGDKTAANGHA